MFKRVAAVLVTAATLLLVSGVLGASPRYPTEPAESATSLQRLQEHLHRLPGDWPSWAALGSAYLEQARITADPSYYQRAEASLQESLRLRPNSAALTGLGALANARHDFAQAATLARQALQDNEFSASAYGVLVDALTQLGRPQEATVAVQRMLDLDPGLPALSRAAYDLEQHGRASEARTLWLRALRDAQGANVAFVHQQLGDLAWHAGDLAVARTEYTLAGHRYGLAKVDAATGSFDAALAGYAALTTTRPSPTLFAEYAILLRNTANSSEVERQLRLADAALALMSANGSVDDLAAAEVAIARGDHAEAVRFCEREWSRRQHSDVADLLGWSLHLAGRDTEAVGFARRANSLGIVHRDYAAHLRIIEESAP